MPAPRLLWTAEDGPVLPTGAADNRPAAVMWAFADWLRLEAPHLCGGPRGPRCPVFSHSLCRADIWSFYCFLCDYTERAEALEQFGLFLGIVRGR